MDPQEKVFMAVIKFSENGLTVPKSLVQYTDVTDEADMSLVEAIRKIRYSVIKNGDYVFVYSVYKSYITGFVSALTAMNLFGEPNFIPKLHTDN